MKWKYCKRFEEMTLPDLYRALKLRQDVFIIEQDCIYKDIDNLDHQCGHLFLYDSDFLAGYARLVPAGVKFEEVSIGRIIIHPNYRNRNLGTKLIRKALMLITKNKEPAVRIEAQQHLEAYYHSFGFTTKSEPYDVDGIQHIEMLKKM